MLLIVVIYQIDFKFSVFFGCAQWIEGIVILLRNVSWDYSRWYTTDKLYVQINLFDAPIFSKLNDIILGPRLGINSSEK